MRFALRLSIFQNLSLLRGLGASVVKFLYVTFWRGARMRLASVSAGIIAIVVLLGGCDGCGPSPQAPAPVAKEGRLPRAPEPATTPQPAAVSPPACAVVATSSVDAGVAPLTVQFSAEGMCTDAAGAFTWDFDDGSAPTREQNPTHVYTKPGTYTAHVTLTDDEHSASDSDETPVTVTAP